MPAISRHPFDRKSHRRQVATAREKSRHIADFSRFRYWSAAGAPPAAGEVAHVQAPGLSAYLLGIGSVALAVALAWLDVTPRVEWLRRIHNGRPGDYVTVSASRYPFASVQTEGKRSEDWVNGISGKLGWNTRQKQKDYTTWGK